MKRITASALYLTHHLLNRDWDAIAIIIGKRTSPPQKVGVSTIVSAALSLGIWVYGVLSFVERDMLSKLLRGFAFDFWDPSRPAVLFFTANIAVMALFAMSVRALSLLSSAYSRGRRK